MTCAFKSTQQSLPLDDDPFEFAARFIGSFREIGQHPFPIRPNLGDDLPTLLLGNFKFLLRFG